MKTHYDPYYSNDPEEDTSNMDQHLCGTPIFDEIFSTCNWKYVSCKKCLENKDKIMAIWEKENELINAYYGNHADFYYGDKND